MKYRPLFSVALTCYNASYFLKDSIESVAKQSYPNWELIIVDDKSTDDSLKYMAETIERFKIQNKTKIFQHDKNAGYGRTLKDAIEKGVGELVAVLDSDDALTPNALGKMVDAHQKNPKASLIYSTRYQCNSKLKIRGIYKSRPLKKGETYLSSYRYIEISHLKTFKRSYYNKTEGLNPNLFKTVDKDLVLKLEEVGDLVFIPDVLYYYRNHSGNITNSFHKRPKKERNMLEQAKNQIFKDAINRRLKKKEETA